MNNPFDVIIIGGGAAGFFSAIRCAEVNPQLRIIILEKSSNVLSKVKISGGGRCNVTHACFDPAELVTYYPRGHRELLGPFHKFMCGDMMNWLADQGIETKIESDGRVFPVSDDAQTIIDCFQTKCLQSGIQILKSCSVQSIQSKDDLWYISSSQGNFTAPKILVATGSSPAFWKLLEEHGCSIVAAVPSLFTMNIQHHLISGLQGLSVANANIKIQDADFSSTGALLITHWGLSGPAVLKLSAWAARELHERQYRFNLLINWTGEERETILQVIQTNRREHGKKEVVNLPYPGIPKRLWQALIQFLPDKVNWASLTNDQINQLCEWLYACRLPVNGKSTFKDEFVTCGGIDTQEVDFRSMESKVFPKLYFAGEVLDIDAVTGGFNFQAAWTTGWIAANAICAGE